MQSVHLKSPDATARIARKVNLYHESPLLEAGTYTICFETGKPGSKKGPALSQTHPEFSEAVEILRATALTNRLYHQALTTAPEAQNITLWESLKEACDARGDGIPWEHGDGFKIIRDSRDKRIHHAVTAVLNMHANGDALKTLRSVHAAGDLSPIDTKKIMYQLRAEKVAHYKALFARTEASAEPAELADAAALLMEWGGKTVQKQMEKDSKVLALKSHYADILAEKQRQAKEVVTEALEHVAP